MHALTYDGSLPGAYAGRASVSIELRRVRLRVPPAWWPALASGLRLVSGTGLGLLIAGFAGHGVFWGLVGGVMGLAMDSVARRPTV